MRIIGGTLGGRKIQPPSNMPFTRPTTDVAKEGLFNILQNRMNFEGISTLDLFGGTGAITYELASRGAVDLTIVEMDNKMAQFIATNLANFKIENCQLVKANVFQFLQNCTKQYDFIFAGPPYALTTIDELPKIIISKKIIHPQGYFVLEHTPRNDYKVYQGYQFTRSYGTTLFSFFK